MLADLYASSKGAFCLSSNTHATFNVVYQFADWMEFYVQALELNVWTSALVEKVGKDEKGRWNVAVRRGGPNGSVRILHPTHVIVATGSFGKPYAPHFEGEVRLLGLWRPQPTTHTLFPNPGKLQGRDNSHIQVRKRERKRREEGCYHRRRNFRARCGCR